MNLLHHESILIIFKKRESNLQTRSHIRFAITSICFLPVLFMFAQTQSISIDASKRYQEIDNFGASDCWSMQKIGEWIDPQKERVADLLFSVDKGIGLSAWRFNIGGGINFSTIQHPWRTVETFETAQGVYDWTRQEAERWFLHAAKERGVDQFIAFVNSPPGRMTRNSYTNCTNGIGSTNLKTGYETQFATYLVDILKHFRDDWQIDFDYISPLNEPQWEWNENSNQEGNRAGNPDIKSILLALDNELNTRNLDTKILAIESGDLESWYMEKSAMESEYGVKYGNYLSSIYSDSDLKSCLFPVLGGHSYWSDLLNSELVQDREALRIRLNSFFNNDWKYWMTEYAILEGPEGAGGRGRDLTIETALNVARVIHFDLTILNASAWQWWTAVSPEDYKDGLIYTDYMDNPSTQNIIESKTLWALGNYSRFIRPGARRIELIGANDKYSLMGSAYISPGEEDIILVFINAGNKNESIAIEIKGLKVGHTVNSLTPYLTSDLSGDDLKRYPDISVLADYSVPARSILTLVGSIEDTTNGNLSDFDADKYSLFQNYPNPFNGKTEFKYYLPESSQVQINIYSILGQKVKTLVNEFKEPGMHDIEWDGTDYNSQYVSSGIYFYSLVAGGNTDHKRLVYVH